MTGTLPKNPVLLIHGINDTAAVFAKLAIYLNELGWASHSLDLVPSNGDYGLDMLAAQIANYVEDTFPPGQPFDLVGFSMGAIVSRYYLQRLGGINRVQRFIAISGPHHGSKLAFFSNRPGCVQMRPGSDFLQDLNGDMVDSLGQINLTSIWTPLDLMILPANSSQLPIGHEVRVPVLLHPWMLTDWRSIQAVAEALEAPLQNQVAEPSPTSPRSRAPKMASS